MSQVVPAGSEIGDDRVKHPRLAARLRDARGSTSQRKFAAQLGVPLSVYGRWERGQGAPRGPNLEMLATGLDITVRELQGTLGVGMASVHSIQTNEVESTEARVRRIVLEGMAAEYWRHPEFLEGARNLCRMNGIPWT